MPQWRVRWTRTSARRALLPLPVLGIPRWWVANEDPAFYDDAFVFRAARVGSVNTPRG